MSWLIGVIVAVVVSWFVPCRPVQGPSAVFQPAGLRRHGPVAKPVLEGLVER